MNWTSIGWASYAVLWIVVLVQVILTLALARAVGRLVRRSPPSGARVINPGPELGSSVSDWEGTDLLGERVSVRFPRKRGLFLLYISPHCSTCAGLLPSAKRFFNEIAAEADSAWVMVSGSLQAQISYARENELTRHPVAAEEQLPPSFRVGGAPFGLWIDSAGHVRAKGMVDRREHLESLRNAVKTGHPSIESYVAARAEETEREREGSAA
jgi:methylamine dehydrogenase accessory protein MauD